MEIKRDLKTNKIYLIDNEKIVLETGSIGAEFLICLYVTEPILITKDFDEFLFMNLKQLLENEYVFDNTGLSYKNGNKIVWFSDQCCDIEVEDETNKISRLILEMINEQIFISTYNPFFDKYNIKRRIVSFSPCFNGFYSKNINTGLCFQDDISIAFYKTLICEYDVPKKKMRKYN